MKQPNNRIDTEIEIIRKLEDIADRIEVLDLDLERIKRFFETKEKKLMVLEKTSFYVGFALGFLLGVFVCGFICGVILLIFS